MRMYRSTTAIAKTKRFDRSSASDWHQHSISLTSKFHISMIRLYNMFNFKIEPDLKWNERSIEEEKNPTATRLTYLFSVWKAAHWSTLDGSCSSTIYNPFECEKSNDQIVNPRLSERAAVLFFLFAHGSGSFARNNFPKWELERIRLSLNFHLVYSAAARPMRS